MSNDILGENTKVKLSLVVAILASFLGGVLWITSSLQSVKDSVSGEMKNMQAEITKVGESAKLSSVQLDSKLDNLQGLVTVQLGVAANDITSLRADVKEQESRIRALELLQGTK